MNKIGKSKNARTLRWLAGQVKVGEIQSSTTKASDHQGITPAFLRKVEAGGLIQIVQKVPGEIAWKKLKEIPSE